MLDSSEIFLKSKEYVVELLKYTDITEGDSVLDIGAGEGIITDSLLIILKDSGRIYAVEKNDEYAEILKDRFANNSNVHLIHKDFMDFEFPQISNFKVFSNIPFNHTSSIFRKLFTPKVKCSKSWIILEKDAATTYIGNIEQSLKSLLLYPFYLSRVITSIPSNQFSPKPSVPIVLMEITRRTEDLIPTSMYDKYLDFIRKISTDRVGEGNWRKLFTNTQMRRLVNEGGLIKGRGISVQDPESILNSFRLFMTTAK